MSRIRVTTVHLVRGDEVDALLRRYGCEPLHPVT